MQDLPQEVKAQKSNASFDSHELGFCKHLHMRQRNLKPFIKSVRVLASTLGVFDSSYYYEI
jgi:hypothetical protein